MLSTVVYRWDADERTIRVSTTADRLKARQIRANPRVALHVNGGDMWSFAVVEGDAEVVETTPEPADGSQPEPDRRVTITLRANRLYGTALDIPTDAGRARRRVPGAANSVTPPGTSPIVEKRDRFREGVRLQALAVQAEGHRRVGRADHHPR
ncbi:pyridoxamine 5'-phosphate oxidase family protein [Goodfellowiella coeruleoviolacea]|uniref:pyridoxamine 5'-phosphate oxidase family protein n=1 Tax=Goodfellowiella coeruleoviolacea TaxID=334858 RepID=UPI0020A2D736|nr:pyridoxamine 5'-phosphate oxidase family protein [Goodfellowiella coeruleoviolacea]